MIVSFKDKTTRAVAGGQSPKGFPPDLLKVAGRKFTMLQYAKVPEDLRSPPGNQLEKLRGDRAGQYSIRINDQWRICFIWTESGPAEIEIVDYHK